MIKLIMLHIHVERIWKIGFYIQTSIINNLQRYYKFTEYRITPYFLLMDIYYNPPESQLSAKMDYKMDMGIIPREMDKQLCLETDRRARAYTSYPVDENWTFYDSINPHHKLNTHLVNICTWIKCEKVFPINCDPFHCPQAKSKISKLYFIKKNTL